MSFLYDLVDDTVGIPLAAGMLLLVCVSMFVTAHFMNGKKK